MSNTTSHNNQDIDHLRRFCAGFSAKQLGKPAIRRLKKLGWIEYTSGSWSLTEAGVAVIDAHDFR